MAKRPRITVANVLSVIAIFLALGGTAVYAANKISGKTVKKNSLPGNRVKKHSLPGNRVKKNTITGNQINEAKLGIVPEATVGGPVAYAYVKGNATVIDSRSRGISSANVSFAGISSYCFKNLPSFTLAQTTPGYQVIDNGNVDARVAYPETSGALAGDCPGAQLEVTTVRNGAFFPYDFSIALFR